MNHNQLVTSLSAADRRMLRQRSDLRGLLHLAGHWGCVIAIGALILIDVPYWQLLMMPQGILLVFLFTLLHETSHQTPFRSKWINVVVGRVSGLVLFLPPKWFRYFHFAHHRHTQIPGKDPELAAPKPESWQQYFVHCSGIPIWRDHIATLFRNAAGNCADEFVPPSRRGDVAREARIMLTIYLAVLVASLAMHTSLLLFVWIIPMLIGQPFLRLYLLAEHGRCPNVTNALENSRTTLTNRATHLLAWNMPYHTEHHCYPDVPFFRLPELHRRVRNHLAQTADGYWDFHRTYTRGFRYEQRQGEVR